MVAVRLAPTLGDEWVEDMTAQYLARQNKRQNRRANGLPEPKTKAAEAGASFLSAGQSPRLRLSSLKKDKTKTDNQETTEQEEEQ